MKKIALLIETSREYSRQLIIGIARYARVHGPWMFYGEPQDPRTSPRHLRRWRPDGIIMRDSPVLKELLDFNVPTIVARHFPAYPKGVPVITTDSRSIARMASDHLIEKGFQNLAFCGIGTSGWSNERKDLFCHYNRKHGYDTHVYVSPRTIRRFDWDREQRHVITWLARLPKPVGVFACNDDRGHHVVVVCKLLGLRVPEEVAVIGVDNDPMVCEIEDPPLSSIALDVEAAGYQAAELLDQMMATQRLTGRHILVSASHIVQRQSTDILAVKDAEVAAALRFIKDHAKDKILVDDVAAAAGIGKRTLEQRFKKVLRRSIAREIRRIRAELIAHLLLETDMPIAHITSLFNFTDVEHISRYFKKEKGIGLRQFREHHKSR